MMSDFSGIQVLVVGDAMLDRYFDGVVESLSPEAPAPVLKHRATRSALGGAANAAANVASLGGEARLVAVVGDDDEGREVSALLGERRIGGAVVVDPGRPTTTKTRLATGGRQLLRIDRETTESLAPAPEREVCEAVEAALDGVGVVIIADYAKGVLTPAVLAAVMAAAKARGVPVLVDPKRADLAAYRGASLIKPNRAELTLATGVACADDASAERAARSVIAETGADVLLTRSEAGMTLYRDGEAPLTMPSRAVEVFDVSGAGDTVIAALALGLASGMDLPRAMRVANTAAGIAVSKAGPVAVSGRELALALRRAPSRADAVKGELVDLARAAAVRERWRAEGLTVGFTNGCFDLLHAGHVGLLRECAAHCDRLIVGLNTDASVRRLKGPDRPVQHEESRAAVIGAIDTVDLVVLFDQATPLELIETLSPDVLIKGADYTEDQVVGAGFVRAAGGKVVLAALADGHSTTRLIARIARGETPPGLAGGAGDGAGQDDVVGRS
jgi:D-beta-D-heptose 7-phosphate kinase / D-beta-D-heptose 1-phosphate adenosyltransferase